MRMKILAVAGLAAAAVAALVATQVATARSTDKPAAAASSSCQIKSDNGNVKHVIYIQFDNTHLLRDNKGVPSDLEQMPHLLQFMEQNGTVVNNHHTILISHTAGGILTSLTGLYPDRNGATVTNSYDFYRTNPANGIYSGTFTSAFKYWTAPVSAPLDSKPNMVNGDSGTAKNTPAPWVSYTRAGCDFGAVSVANTVLENTGLSPANGDIYEVFGPTSPEFAQVTAQSAPANDAKTKAIPQADYVGIAVHCGAGGGICNNAQGSRPDKLPDEPGGYNGFQALFGAKYVDKAIAGTPAVSDINGNPILDSQGNPGFPGFDSMPASTSLGFIAQMQEAGIPVTYAYISDAHDNHAGFGAYGPGEAGYVAELKNYDNAFAKFFDRLAKDGINKSNTLFVFTADEGDHYAGEQAQNCDGVTTPCVYNTEAGKQASGKPAHGIIDLTNGATASSSTWTPPAWPPANQNGALVGEIGMDLKWLFGPMPAGYDISFDSAPSFYIDGQPQAVDANGNIALNPTLRAFEQRAGAVQAFDPYLDTKHFVPVANYLVDAPTLKALHMINADPQRTMSFTMFSKSDMYFQTFSPCPSPMKACLSDSFAYIHGDYAPDIGQTWLGMVGPGVKKHGVDDKTWSDHADVVPTIMSLVGLKTDYQPDGRVITEMLKGDGEDQSGVLGPLYKQLNAPYGDFAHSLIVASTKGIKSTDAQYLEMEHKIQDLTAARDALVVQMKNALGKDGDEHGSGRLVSQGLDLLRQARMLAAS